jgi:hypothetical protein
VRREELGRDIRLDMAGVVAVVQSIRRKAAELADKKEERAERR